eukprot:CAMPEP_0185026988 /NCGR_PEP_ID=MMETSP1103-20130426/11733_1 /TAXON_ID=36769 /ORGANISM="Paraphysomonas bandaiensis, Strain Caron Lab Isolate" /LENGTH=413 /DNA_ID=CAMNT_0027560793 /DNA_START=116 /DNA_END=1357 /DNA_ORIENTATION=-
MFSQLFGDPDDISNEANIFSALEFNGRGDLLASGDHGGSIVIHKKNDDIPQKASVRDVEGAENQWQVHCQFQSHEQEFDYLKSLEIEEKINHIQWGKPLGDSSFLYTTNDKTIKLWKVGRHMQRLPGAKYSSIRDGVLSLNRRQETSSAVSAMPKRSYCNAHAYHINSVSCNSDGESFLSADDLRINWWNSEINTSSFNIVDIKPSNMEELTEVITSAQFHPEHCNILMYSSSRGSIKLGDTRRSALCDVCAKVFEEPEDAASKSFFSEIVASISDASFAGDGRYIISRDYLTLKVWDTHMETKPVRVININDSLKSILCELYESDCIFDKFEIAVSPDGQKILTGSYGNQFSVWNKAGYAEHSIELQSSGGRSRTRDAAEADFDKKVLHCAWNPSSNTIALTAQAALYLYKV